MEKNEEFYSKLLNTLEETTKFPSPYLYKFIVPANGEGVKDLESIFDPTNAKIDTKPSKTGKYIAVSIKLTVQSAQQVIDLYKKAATISGIISL